MGRFLYAPALGGPVKPSPRRDVAEAGLVRVFLDALNDVAEAGLARVFLEGVGTSSGFIVCLAIAVVSTLSAFAGAARRASRADLGLVEPEKLLLRLSFFSGMNCGGKSPKQE